MEESIKMKKHEHSWKLCAIGNQKNPNLKYLRELRCECRKQIFVEVAEGQQME